MRQFHPKILLCSVFLDTGLWWNLYARFEHRSKQILWRCLIIYTINQKDGKGRKIQNSYHNKRIFLEVELYNYGNFYFTWTFIIMDSNLNCFTVSQIVIFDLRPYATFACGTESDPIFKVFSSLEDPNRKIKDIEIKKVNCIRPAVVLI